MIRPEDVREHLHKQPFEPFRICLSDGTRYDVVHPDLCLLSRNTTYVGKANPRKPGVAMGVHHVALVHVARFEPVDGAARKTTRKRK